MEARDRAAQQVRLLEEHIAIDKGVITSRQNDIDAAQARIAEAEAERAGWYELLGWALNDEFQAEHDASDDDE